MEEPFGLQDSSQEDQVENLKSFHLFFGCVSNLGSMQQDSDNSSLVDPDLGWGLDSSVVPYIPELMRSSISPLNSYIKVLVNGSIATDSCANVHKIADLLNRPTLNHYLNMITPEIWALGGTSVNSHALSLLCIYPQTSIGSLVCQLVGRFL